jgi:hypothetical protein
MGYLLLATALKSHERFAGMQSRWNWITSNRNADLKKMKMVIEYGNKSPRQPRRNGTSQRGDIERPKTLDLASRPRCVPLALMKKVRPAGLMEKKRKASLSGPKHKGAEMARTKHAV